MEFMHKAGKGPQRKKDNQPWWKKKSATVQAKLEMSQPGDKHEQEADAIARKVVSGDDASVEGIPQADIQAKADDEMVMSVSMKGAEQETIQAKLNEDIVMPTSETEEPELSDTLESDLESAQGSGNPLDEAIRLEMESKMGIDLSDVRIHTDAKADEMARSINAKAFTYGRDIYFREGMYNPYSDEGKELLAHELVHTQQQQQQHLEVSRRIMRDEERKPGQVSEYRSLLEYEEAGTRLFYPQPAFNLGSYTSFWRGILEANFTVRFDGKDSYTSEEEMPTAQRLKLRSEEQEAVMRKAWELRPKAVQDFDISKDTYTWEGDFTEAKSVSLNVRGGLPGTPEDKKETYSVFYVFTYKGKDAYMNRPSIDISYKTDSTRQFIDASQTSDYGTPVIALRRWVEANPESDEMTSYKWPYALSYPRVEGKDAKYWQYEFFNGKGKDQKTKLHNYLNKKFNDYNKLLERKKGPEELIITENIRIGNTPFFIDLRFAKYGNADKAAITFVNIMYLGGPKEDFVNNAPDQRDQADAKMLLFLRDHPGVSEQLKIHGLEKIHNEHEKAVVKHLVFDYTFEKPNYNPFEWHPRLYFRDLELDQIVRFSDPGDPKKIQEVYYTFIIEKKDEKGFVNVTIKRIGENGVDFPDPLGLRLQRVNGYEAAKLKPITEFRKWLLSRYPAIANTELQGNTHAEITDSFNKVMQGKKIDKTWLQDNYKILINNAGENIELLTDTFKYNDLQKPRAYYKGEGPDAKEVEPSEEGAIKVADETTGIKNWTDNELLLLELMFQKLGTAEIQLVKGTNYYRQDRCLLPGLFNSAGGLTHTNGKAAAVMIYNSAFQDVLDQTFFGGEGDVNSKKVKTLAHETGHVIAHKKDAANKNNEEKFNYYVKNIITGGIKPITLYSKQNKGAHSPESEFFPEAFMIFHNDPVWMKSNQPYLYIWFEHLAATGKGPLFEEIKKQGEKRIVNGVLIK